MTQSPPDNNPRAGDRDLLIQLVGQVSAMSGQLSMLLASVSTLSSSVRQSDDRIVDLRGQIQTNQVRQDEHEKKIEKQGTEIADLRIKNQDLTSQITQSAFKLNLVWAGVATVIGVIISLIGAYISHKVGL